MAELRLSGATLTLPEGFTAHALQAGNDDDREAVMRFANKSPDRTIYHRAPYFRFARSQSSRPDITQADLVLFSVDTNPLFALPVHPRGRAILTHYSGVLFPEGHHEPTLRRAVEALAELFQANRRLHFSCVQAAVAPAYDDIARLTLLERLLIGCDLPVEPIYSRMVRVGEWADRGVILDAHSSTDVAGAVSVTRAALEGEALTTYPLRHAQQDPPGTAQRGSRSPITSPKPTSRARAAYRAFTPIHEASWRRTGMRPHGLEYWTAFSAAVTAGGGRDLVVLAGTADTGPVAAVSFHLYQGRAVYWAGVSHESGQRLAANPLCLHAALTISAAIGATVVELGRFTPHEPSAKERAITNYKAQFGGELTRVLSFSSPLRRRDRASAPARRLAARSLSRLRPPEIGWLDE